MDTMGFQVNFSAVSRSSGALKFSWPCALEDQIQMTPASEPFHQWLFASKTGFVWTENDKLCKRLAQHHLNIVSIKCASRHDTPKSETTWGRPCTSHPCLAHPAFNTISPCKATSFTNVIDIVSMQHITQIPSILMFPSCPHTAFYCPPISSRHAPVYARLRYGQEYSGDWIVSSPRTLRGDLWTGRAAPPVIFVGGSVDL